VVCHYSPAQHTTKDRTRGAVNCLLDRHSKRTVPGVGVW
jgi:hypothetical protein